MPTLKLSSPPAVNHGTQTSYVFPKYNSRAGTGQMLSFQKRERGNRERVAGPKQVQNPAKANSTSSSGSREPLLVWMHHPPGMLGQGRHPLGSAWQPHPHSTGPWQPGPETKEAPTLRNQGRNRPSSWDCSESCSPANLRITFRGVLPSS